MNINLFEIWTYFIIYSFLGWILESIYRSICEKKLINTGFLKGPICPIYGFGAIIMLMFLESLSEKPILLFIVSLITLTLWEYIVGVLLEKIFKTKYWDYSEQRFNFQGRICLTNSIFWGILGVVFVKYIHNFIEGIVINVNINIVRYLVGIVSLIFLVDMITTIVNVKNIKGTLEKIESLNKEIKEKLKELRSLKKDTDKSESLETAQKFIEKLNRKRNKTILQLYKNVYRLKKAFPAINTKEITEVLNKKIKTIKKDKNA